MVTLLDTKLSLLKVEVKEDVAAYVRGSASLVVSGVAAALGCALLSITVAFVIAAMFENTDLSQPLKYAIGTGIAGATLLLGGVVLGKRTARGLRQIAPLPERSVEELEKDKQWLGS
jgi:uncharacterized membrane protein YqjE